MSSRASSAQTPSFDIFLSHAGEDKETIARPLFERLCRHGISVFFDVESFRLGDDCPQVMDHAMQTAPVGVFIMSPEFVAKEWPMRELICFVKRYDCPGATETTSPLLIPVFYRLTTRDCRDPAIFDTYSSLFLQHGLIKRAMDGIIPLQDVSHALHTAATVWSIENDLGASNSDRPDMASTRKSFIDKVESRILERLQNERPDLADKCRPLEGEPASRSEPSFRKIGTVPPNPPRLTLDYESSDTFEGKLKAAVLEPYEHKMLAVVAAGRGGVGKTCALRGLNDVGDVQSRFPDGMQFMRLGKDGGIGVLIQEIARVVEATGNERLGSNIRSVKQLQKAVDKAKKWFAPYTCLFLVDDVWMSNGFDPNTFSVLAYMVNKDSRLVYTTREKELAEEADKRIYFGPREAETSRVMFLKHSEMQHCNIEKKVNIEALEWILEACAGIPFLLAVTGSGVREYFSLLKGPKEDALHLYHKKLQREPNKMVESTVTGYGPVRNVTNASIAVLELRWAKESYQENCPLSIREMHRSLCVLQKHQEVPVSMLRRLWGLRKDTSALEVMKALHSVAVVDLAILENKGELSSVLRVHDDILDALMLDTENEKPWHFKRLLDNYCSGPGDAVAPEAKMVSANVDERETTSSGAWLKRERFRRGKSNVSEGEVENELAVVDCTTKRKRREWWNVVDDDEYLVNNLCRLLHEAGEYEELIWLLLKPQWVVKRLQTGGVFGVENDVSTGKQALDCSDMERKEEKKRALGVIAHAARLSYHALIENAREAHFQLYGRLVGYSEKCKIIRRFVKEVEEIADRPWLKAKKGFLTAAGGAVLESISVEGYVRGVVKQGNDLKVLCHCSDEIMRIVKYNVKYGSRSTVEMVGSFDNVAMSNDGQTVVCVDDGGHVMKWDAELRVRTEIGQKTAGTRCICVSEDSRWVACGLEGNGKVLVWNVQGGDAPRELVTGREEGVNCVAVSGSRRKVVCGLNDGTIWIWHVENGEAVCEALSGHRSAVECVAFSGNGEMVSSGSGNRSIRVWHAETGRCLGAAEVGGWVLSVAFAAEDTKILWGSWDGAFGLWERENGGAVKTVLRNGEAVCYVGISGDGSEGLCAGRDGTVRVWDMSGVQAEIGSGDEDGHDEAIRCVAVSADGNRIASGSEDGTIRLWDGESGALLPEVLRGHSGPVRDVSFSADGRRLVSGGDDATVRVWDVRSARAVGEPLRGHGHDVSNVAMSADGARAASASGLEVRVWDTQRGVAVTTGTPLIGNLLASTLAMSQDGTRVASASLGKMLCVWDVVPGVLPKIIFLPDTPCFVSLGSASAIVWHSDGSAYLCSLEDATCVPHPAPPPCPLGSSKMELELGDSQHHRLHSTADMPSDTLYRTCKLGFFYVSGRGLRFCQVQQ